MLEADIKTNIHELLRPQRQGNGRRIWRKRHPSHTLHRKRTQAHSKALLGAFGRAAPKPPGLIHCLGGAQVGSPVRPLFELCVGLESHKPRWAQFFLWKSWLAGLLREPVVHVVNAWLCSQLAGSLSHTHTCTHAHTLTHSYLCSHTLKCTHSHTHTFTHPCAHTPMYAHVYACTHTYIKPVGPQLPHLSETMAVALTGAWHMVNAQYIGQYLEIYPIISSSHLCLLPRAASE